MVHFKIGCDRFLSDLFLLAPFLTRSFLIWVTEISLFNSGSLPSVQQYDRAHDYGQERYSDVLSSEGQILVDR